MVLIDNLIDDTYTEKLKVPVGVQVRGYAFCT